MSRQGPISRGKGLPSSRDGREGALSVRTVRGMGVQLAYKLGSKWYYTKLNDRPVDNGTTLNTSKMPRIPGELSVSHGKLYLKPSSSESAKEVLFNNNNASIGAGRLSLDSDKTISSTDGAVIHIDAHDVTDNYTATGGTTTFSHVKIEPPVLKASNAAVVTSHAGTLEITGPPSAGLNQTITNPYDIYLSNASSKIGATDLTIDVVGGQLTIESSAAGFADPDLILIGKHDSIAGYAGIQLESHRNGTDNNQDYDILGEVGFYGYNDNGDRTLYSAFYTQAIDVSDGDERGLFYFQCRTNSAGSGGSSAVTALKLEGSATDDVCDVSIGYGATSMTTIAGDLDIDGDAITAPGNLSITPTGDFTVTPGGNDVSFNGANNFNITGASGIADPMLLLTGTHNGTDGPILKLAHIPSDSSEADGDKLGRIRFAGLDSDNNVTDYAEIEGLTGDVTTDTEAGSLRFKVITENASAPVLTTGFKLAGSDTNDEVDVWLGSGSACLTSVMGDLLITGSITKTGNLSVDVSGDIALDAAGGNISLLDDGGTYTPSATSDATTKAYVDGKRFAVNVFNQNARMSTVNIWYVYNRNFGTTITSADWATSDFNYAAYTSTTAVTLKAWKFVLELSSTKDYEFELWDITIPADGTAALATVAKVGDTQSVSATANAIYSIGQSDLSYTVAAGHQLYFFQRYTSGSGNAYSYPSGSLEFEVA